MKIRLAIAACCSLAAIPSLATAADGDTVRFATFNASLNRFAVGDLVSDLSQPTAVDYSIAYPNSAAVSALSTQQRRVLQAHYVAEVLQRVNADVVLVNEFDYDLNGAGGTSATPSPFGYRSVAAQSFNSNFLNTTHGGGTTGRSLTAAIDYQHGYTPTTNTGLHSGFDLDNSGVIDNTPGDGGFGNDAFGFGEFPGKFGFTIYSKFEVTNVRTFQNFLWKDMPGNLLTNDPTGNNLANFYSADEINALKLSSKNHVDVTLNVNGREVHFLTAHPTPPVFDGAEDRNGKRNFDEIRFWKDYINGENYIYDDQGGTGGLAADALFVIAGDYNADPCDGDSFKSGCAGGVPLPGPNAIMQLLGDEAVNQLTNPLSSETLIPQSLGGAAAATDPSNNGPANQSHQMDPAQDTADFNDAAPGNLRVDYVLPSANLTIADAGVFWPDRNDPLFPLVGTFNNINLFSGFPTSDHKAVYVDVVVAPVPVPAALPLLGTALIALGARQRRRKGLAQRA